MARKQAIKESTPLPKSAQLIEKEIVKSSSGNILPVILTCLFFVVHFIPGLGALDTMGPQWFYIILLDLVIAGFILAGSQQIDSSIAAVVKTRFSYLYLAFLLICFLSVFVALNPTETWVCLVRLVATVVAFFNMAILLHKRAKAFGILSQVLSVLLLIESILAMRVFFEGLESTGLDQLILTLRSNTGNKNIFAASLVVKIPFVLYCIYTSRLWGKAFHVLVLLLGATTIFIVNARSSYVGLALVLFLFLLFSFLQYQKNKQSTTLLYQSATALLPILAAVFVSQLIIGNAQTFQGGKGGYGTVAERVSTIGFTNEASSYRLKLWEHAIDYIKEKPITGSGYGNWKIASIPYEKEYIDDLYVPLHSHNDFLEMAAETGIVGGLLYLSLFVCLLINTIRTYFSDADETYKLIAVFSFMGLAAYSVDAALNFPMERPVMQVFFAFLAAVNVGAFIGARENSNRPANPIAKPLYGLLSILLLLPSAYVGFLTYQSMVVQMQVVPDLENEPLKLSLAEVNRLPSIPNLSASSQPIEAIKGRYYYENKRYPEALELMTKGGKANPNIYYSEFLKSSVFYMMGNLDSSYAQIKEAFYNRPRAKTYYQNMVAIAARRGDTIAVQKAFQTFRGYRNEPLAWNLYLTAMLTALKNVPHPGLLRVADSALQRFPNDASLLQRKREIVTNMSAPAVATVSNAAQVEQANRLYNAAVAAFSKADYATAANGFVKSAQAHLINYSVYENAAISYYNLKEYQKAIRYFDKVIALKAAMDGKSEYFKGASLLALGNKEAGCQYLQIAKARNYPQADATIAGFCK